MNILKSHIRLRQQLRQVASNTLGELEPDEIDDYINQAEQLFLTNIVDPRKNKDQIGFEQSYQRFAQIGMAPTTIVRELKSISPDMMVGALPTFLHCPTRFEVSTEKCKITYTTKTFKVAVIPFKVPHDLQDFSQFSIVVGAVSIEPEGRALYLNPENTQHFIRLLNNTVLSGVEVYWESIDTMYEPNSLIIKIPTSNPAETAIITYSSGYSETINFETISYSVSALSTDGVYRGCRIAQQEDVADMLIDPFQTTKHDRPLVEIQGKLVIVHHNDKFTPKLLRIGYIPIPNPVSYNLNISSEMPETTHEAIIALASELIQQDMSNMPKQRESR